MGLFNFRKEKNTKATTKNNEYIVVAKPIFVNNERCNLEQLVVHLQQFWGLSLARLSGNVNVAIFDIGNLSVDISYVDLPISQDEMNNIIPYAYLWRGAEAELKKQTGYAVITVLGDSKDMVAKFTLLSKLLISCLLQSENCVAIYQEKQKLLLHRDFYLSAVDDLKNNRIPVSAWVYIGIKQSETSFDSYTIGMAEFSKSEIEIIGSKYEPNIIYKVMLGIISHILSKDINFGDGDKFKISEAVAISLSLSEGVHSPGITLKLEV